MSGLLMIAAAAAAAFNLNCAGNLRVSGGSPEPFSTVIHVDLDKNKWCADSCKAIFDISKVDPGSLKLEDSSQVWPTGKRTRLLAVNRETGAYYDEIRSNGDLLSYTGTCEKAEFTGFPSVETKF